MINTTNHKFNILIKEIVFKLNTLFFLINLLILRIFNLLLMRY